MTERTEAEWRAVAEGLPGWGELHAKLAGMQLTIQWAAGPRVRGIITDHCERAGWLRGIMHPTKGQYTAWFRSACGSSLWTVPAPTAVHALILAAEARHAADPARGWC